MRGIFSQKRFIFLLAVLGIVTLLILPAGLPALEFGAGRSLGWATATPSENTAEEMVRQFTDAPLWEQGAFWILLLSLALFLGLLVSPEARKRMVRALLSLGLTLFVLSYLVENNLITLPEIEPIDTNAFDTGDLAGQELPAPPAFSPPELPDWTTYLISLGMILALLGLGWLLLRWWRQQYRPRVSPETLRDLASIARSSLRDLSTDSDWADAITNCYVRMSQVVSNARGLYREDAMTPGEFAYELERAGLPAAPVHQLTRLFEAVRYGTRKPARSEINQAVSCLTDILYYCGEEV